MIFGELEKKIHRLSTNYIPVDGAVRSVTLLLWLKQNRKEAVKPMIITLDIFKKGTIEFSV